MSQSGFEEEIRRRKRGQSMASVSSRSHSGRPLLADGAARARAAGVAHDLRGDGLMSRRRITWRQSTRASETAPASVWQPSFTLLKLSLDVRSGVGSLGYINAVLKLRKRYRLYPSWLVGWPIFDARLSGGRPWVKAFCCDRSDESLLDGRKTSQAGWCKLTAEASGC